MLRSLALSACLVGMLLGLTMTAMQAAEQFSLPDPQAVVALSSLTHEFIRVSGFTNFVCWLLAGLLCVIALRRPGSTATVEEGVHG